MPHAILLGDSIFDNAAYVDIGSSVIQHVLSQIAPDRKATQLTVDGSVTDEVAVQLNFLSSDPLT